ALRACTCTATGRAIRSHRGADLRPGLWAGTGANAAAGRRRHGNRGADRANRPHDGKYVGPISVDYYLDFGRVLLEFAPPASALSARTHQNCRTHEEQEAFLTPRIGHFRPHLGRPRLVRSRS